VLVAGTALAAGAVILKTTGWLETLPSFLIPILALLALGTVFIFYRLRRIPHTHTDKFTTAYLTSIVLKLLLGSAFLLLVVLADAKSAFENASVFLAGYLVFTGLEVLFLMREKNKS